MKFVKLFLSALFLLTLSISNFTYAKTVPSPKSKVIKDFTIPALSNYIEYHSIDGVIWVVVFNNDGKEIDRYPLE